MKRFILIIVGVLIILPATSQDFIIKDAKYDKYLKYGINEISIKPQHKKIFTFSAGVVGAFSTSFLSQGNPVGGGAGIVLDMDIAKYFGFQTQLLFSKRSCYEKIYKTVYESYTYYSYIHNRYETIHTSRRVEEIKKKSGPSIEFPIMLSVRMPIGRNDRIQLDFGYELLFVDMDKIYHGIVCGLAYTHKFIYAGVQSFIQPKEEYYDFSIKAGVLFKCQKKNRSVALY